VVRAFFRHAREARGNARIVEKTPKHLHYLDHLFTSAPHARAVILVRHPVDIYSSYMRRLEKERALEERDFSWLELTVKEFIKQYSRDAGAAVRANRASTDRTFLLKYEDFVSCPEQEFRKICSFVDTPFESDPIKGRCEDLDFWEPDPYLAKPITENTKDWREHVTETEAAQIENRLQGALEDFGYEAYTS
jgi:hypothetical protein